MNDKAIKLIRLIYGIAVSIMLVISGLLLTAACLEIYHSGGEQIYTPEKVAAAFAPIAAPIYITLAMIAGSFLLEWLLPTHKKRPPMEKQYAFMLRKAYEKVDLQLCDPDLLQGLRQVQKKRHRAQYFAFVSWVIGSIIFLPYACNGSNYSEQLHLATDSVIAIIWLLIPCTLIPTGCSIFSAYFVRTCLRQELELVKYAPKAVERPQSPARNTDHGLLYIRAAVLMLALVMLIGGFVAGGTADVLAKAVAICTECVGLG